MLFPTIDFENSKLSSLEKKKITFFVDSDLSLGQSCFAIWIEKNTSTSRSLSASTHPYSIFQLGVKPEVTWLYICKTDAEIRPESFAIAHSALVKSFSIVENSP
jgi:hypothetical protein